MIDPVGLIGGTPRSGTTLVRNMLDSHPELALPDESYFMSQVWQELRRERRLDDIPRALALVAGNPSFHRWEWRWSWLVDEIGDGVVTAYPDLLRALFSAYARGHGKVHSADKTTDNVVHAPRLARWFPTSRIVHVMRDPRSVAMSLTLQHWHTGGLAAAGVVWRNHVLAYRRFAAENPTRCHEVRYERLIVDPEAELRHLCSFLDVDFSPRMLDHTRSRTLLKDAHHDRSRSEIRSGARRWWIEMSDDEISAVELGAGKLMDEVGYLRRTRPTPAAVTELLRFKARGRIEQRLAAAARQAERRRITPESDAAPVPLTATDVAQLEDELARA